MTLSLAGFQAGKTVLAPAIGGSVGNAVTQLARALGAKHTISSTTNHTKAMEAKALGFNEVIDGSSETLSDGVRRITDENSVDIVIDAIGGEVFSGALATLAPGGTLITLGYAAGRKTTIDVTDVIWKSATIKGFLLFAQPPAAWRKRGRPSPDCFNPAASSQSWLGPSHWSRRLMLCAILSRTGRSAESSLLSDGFNSLLRREGKSL
jgi:NADPH:quinone reductase-like Zn-dependent oxidoreductase